MSTIVTIAILYRIWSLVSCSNEEMEINIWLVHYFFLFHRFTVIRFPMVKLCKHKVSFISLRSIIKYQWDHINICHKRFTNGDKTLRNSKKPSNIAAMFWQISEIGRCSSSLNVFLRKIQLLTSVVFMLTFHELLKTSAKFRYCYKDLACMKIELYIQRSDSVDLWRRY